MRPSLIVLILAGTLPASALAGGVLATDGTSVFRLSPERNELLQRRIDSADGRWRSVTLVGPDHRFAALDRDPSSGALYALDVSGELWRVEARSPERGIRVARFLSETPLDGADVAVRGGRVFLGVPGRGVFRLEAETFVPLPGLRFEDGAGLALSERHLVTTSPSQRKVFIRDLETSSPDQVITRSGAVETKRGALRSATTSPIVGEIEEWIPGPVETWGGIAYVADRAVGTFVAFSVEARQPVTLPHLMERMEAVSIAVWADSLFVLGEGMADVERFPRLIPVLLSSNGGEDADGDLTGLLGRLHANGALPLLQVTFDEKLKQQLAVAPGGRQRGQLDFTHLICKLNPEQCGAGMPRVGETIWFPAITEERYVTAIDVDLRGRPVSEHVGRLVTSGEFAQWRAMPAILRMNPQLKKASSSLMTRSAGVVALPAEHFRYVTALPPDFDASLGAQSLDAAVQATPGENRGMQPKAVEVGLPWDMQQVKVQEAFAKLRRRIQWPATPPPPDLEEVVVGVAERRFDWTHPALKGVPLFLRDRDPPPTFQPAGPPETRILDLTSPPGAADHGNAVAALIAASDCPVEGGRGLAQRVKVLELSGELAQLLKDLPDAFTDGTFIFNLSGEFTGAGALTQLLLRRENARRLFMVAAGNDEKRVLESTDELPKLGGEPNVVVVAATDLEGNLWPKSNHDPQLVALAAPGADYFSAGSTYSYVAGAGTSFATAIVTAVAAELFRKGLIGSEIKLRMMATATRDPALMDKVASGHLNAELALLDPTQSWVLRDNDQGFTRFGLVHPATRVVFRNEHRSFELRGPALRRLSRHPDDSGKFDVAYLDGSGRLAWLDGVEPDDGAVIRRVSRSPVPVIGIKHLVARSVE